MPPGGGRQNKQRHMYKHMTTSRVSNLTLFCSPILFPSLISPFLPFLFCSPVLSPVSHSFVTSCLHIVPSQWKSLCILFLFVVSPGEKTLRNISPNKTNTPSPSPNPSFATCVLVLHVQEHIHIQACYPSFKNMFNMAFSNTYFILFKNR